MRIPQFPLVVGLGDKITTEGIKPLDKPDGLFGENAVDTGEKSAILRELRDEGRLIPFIGAGLSVPLGLPSWSDLIDIIANQLGYDPEVFKLNGNNLQLAEYYVAIKGGIGPLRSEMDRLFNPTDDIIKKSKAHCALVDMRLPLIYTTNYDRIIERAFELKGIAVPHDRQHR